MRLHRWLLLTCAVIAMAGAAAAQTQITTAVIEGVVIDSSEASSRGSTSRRERRHEFHPEVVTDSEGRFSALQLPSGRYTVTFRLSGFATLVQEDVEVSVGQSLRLLPEMRPSGVAETVNVTVAGDDRRHGADRRDKHARTRRRSARRRFSAASSRTC